MTPSDRPNKTAAEQAALAAGREKHEAVAPVEVVKESQAVQDTTKEAAALVAGEAIGAAGLFEGQRKDAATELAATTAETERLKAAVLALATTRAFILAMVVAVLTILVPGVTGVIAVIYARSNAVEIEKIKVTGIETHAAVNSAMRQQLYSSLVDKKLMASEKPGDKGREAAVKLAQAALDEHDRNQAKTDAKENQ